MADFPTGFCFYGGVRICSEVSFVTETLYFRRQPFQLSVISYQLSDASFQFTDYCLLITELGMVRSGGINRLNPYLAKNLIDEFVLVQKQLTKIAKCLSL
ncbi:hypothetical protein FXO09_22585 [Microcystis aeruginosa KLA2]|jgi:hypothetical protein|nr:hypothetical protein FXO09_22585 [Microcystis aeruginosa KLA2]